MVARTATARRTPTTVATTSPRSLEEWAVAEAKRIMTARQTEQAVAAKAAARRAPGLMAAARALRRLSDVDELTKAIPLNVRNEVAGEDPTLADDEAVTKVHQWLNRSPFELTRCKLALAAIAAAAPIARIETQKPDSGDAALEAKVLMILEQSAVRRQQRNALAHANEPANGSRDRPCGARGAMADQYGGLAETARVVGNKREHCRRL